MTIMPDNEAHLVPSEAEHKLVEAHQLGTPQSSYRRKKSHVRTFRYCGWAWVLLMFLWLTLFFYRGFSSGIWGLAESQTNDDLILQLLAAFFLFVHFVLSSFIMLRMAHRLQRERIIVCEYGLLLAKQQVTALRWEDILFIHETGWFKREYTLQPRKGERVSLNGTYQELDALVAQIRLHVKG